jgi:hypothetical protein
MRLYSAAALSMVALLTAGAARAATVHFAATLTGGDEVPANGSAGRGQFSAELETDELTLVYRATYSGLTGPATMAHIHGPAAPGANAPPIVMVPSAASPITGAMILTADQADALLAGKMYFNVHTAANPGGEIRGQIKRQN